jgi:hypothetical protein
LEFKTILNVLIACWSSTSDQAESASLASSIEHVHNFTVILPHRMQGMIRSPYSLKHHTSVEPFSALVGGPVLGGAYARRPTRRLHASPMPVSVPEIEAHL